MMYVMCSIVGESLIIILGAALLIISSDVRHM